MVLHGKCERCPNRDHHLHERGQLRARPGSGVIGLGDVWQDRANDCRRSDGTRAWTEHETAAWTTLAAMSQQERAMQPSMQIQLSNAQLAHRSAAPAEVKLSCNSGGKGEYAHACQFTRTLGRGVRRAHFCTRNEAAKPQSKQRALQVDLRTLVLADLTRLCPDLHSLDVKVYFSLVCPLMLSLLSISRIDG